MQKAPKKVVQLWETFFTEAFNASLNYDANTLTFKSPVAQQVIKITNEDMTTDLFYK